MVEKIIGKKVFILTSNWNGFDGFFEEPLVFTTLIKANAEMKRQVKSYMREWKGKEYDVEEKNANASSKRDDIGECSWDISETTLR